MLGLARTSLFLAAAVLCLSAVSGCHRSEPPKALPIPPPPPPTADASNAFSVYFSVADEIEKTNSPNLNRTLFFPEGRKQVIAMATDAMRKIQACKLPAQFPYVPYGPFDPMPRGKGWRLIGRAFAFDITRRIAEEKDRATAIVRADEKPPAPPDYSAAIEETIAATRFGFDLTGGGATEADLGMHIVDDARRAMLAAFYDLTPANLRRLRDGIKDALFRRAPIGVTIANEEKKMLLAIDQLHEAYLHRDFAAFDQRLGNEGKDASVALAKLGDNDAEEYFKTFRDDAHRRATWAYSRAVLNATGRAQLEAELKKQKKFPKFGAGLWKRYSWHFCLTLEPLISIDDACVSRTRLFILAAELQARRKVGQRLPPDLAGFTPEIARDPFSGERFIYQSDGESFKVYSVGEDLTDSGGEFHDGYTRPDLGIELKLL